MKARELSLAREEEARELRDRRRDAKQQHTTPSSAAAGGGAASAAVKGGSMLLASKPGATDPSVIRAATGHAHVLNRLTTPAGSGISGIGLYPADTPSAAGGGGGSRSYK